MNETIDRFLKSRNSQCAEEKMQNNAPNPAMLLSKRFHFAVISQNDSKENRNKTIYIRNSNDTLELLTRTKKEVHITTYIRADMNTGYVTTSTSSNKNFLGKIMKLSLNICVWRFKYLVTRTNYFVNYTDS